MSDYYMLENFFMEKANTHTDNECNLVSQKSMSKCLSALLPQNMRTHLSVVEKGFLMGGG
jgi:hypothetical protein